MYISFHALDKSIFSFLPHAISFPRDFSFFVEHIFSEFIAPKMLIIRVTKLEMSSLSFPDEGRRSSARLF